jgi:hypothetical protein
MVVGTTLFKLDGNAYFSPEFPRGGLAATFATSVTHLVNSADFTITVQHKSREETTFADLGTFAVITAIGESQEDMTGLKEIIRFKYTFDGGDSWNAAVHFFMQAPSWRPY